jgi:hypothetical protein
MPPAPARQPSDPPHNTEIPLLDSDDSRPTHNPRGSPTRHSDTISVRTTAGDSIAQLMAWQLQTIRKT